jgi:hypothetical protein
VALNEHHIARMLVTGCAPEVVEPDFVQRCRGRVARDVAAVLGALPIGLHDHRHGIPADVCLDTLLERAIAGILDLLSGRDRVDVRRVRLERKVRTRAPREIDHALEQVLRALRALRLEHRVDGLEPLAGFDGIGVFELGSFKHPAESPARSGSRRIER